MLGRLLVVVIAVVVPLVAGCGDGDDAPPFFVPGAKAEDKADTIEYSFSVKQPPRKRWMHIEAEVNLAEITSVELVNGYNVTYGLNFQNHGSWVSADYALPLRLLDRSNIWNLRVTGTKYQRSDFPPEIVSLAVMFYDEKPAEKWETEKWETYYLHGGLRVPSNNRSDVLVKLTTRSGVSLGRGASTSVGREFGFNVPVYSTDEITALELYYEGVTFEVPRPQAGWEALASLEIQINQGPGDQLQLDVVPIGAK